MTRSGANAVPETQGEMYMKKCLIILSLLLFCAVGCTKKTQEDFWEIKSIETNADTEMQETVSLSETEESKTIDTVAAVESTADETETTVDVDMIGTGEVDTTEGEIESFLPDPDTCLFHSRNGSVHQWDDDTLYIVPAKWDAFFWQVEGAYRVWIDDENTFSLTLFEENDNYEIHVDMQSHAFISVQQEKTELLSLVGIAQEDVLSMRYVSRVSDPGAYVRFQVLTKTAYFAFEIDNGVVIKEEKETLFQTQTPTEKDIYENFQKMIRYVNYELALNENTQYDPLDTGDEADLYFRNERYAIDTPETLAYVFSCFLTEDDVTALMQVLNYNGKRWWQTNDEGKLYIGPVTFGLLGLYGQKMTIMQAADGNFDVVVVDGNECTDRQERHFRYIWNGSHWCWQLS